MNNLIEDIIIKVVNVGLVILFLYFVVMFIKYL